jgi:hypothetical protein
MLALMSRVSYTAEGFRAAFRRPALAFAEIAWRWVAGGTAAAVLIFALFEYLGSLPVTNAELLFLRTKQPFLVGRVIEHILRGSLNRVVLAGLLAALALIALWIVAASAGRDITVRGLLRYFAARRDAAGETSAATPEKRSMRALIRLSFLRAAVALAAICGFVGAALLAGFASPEANPQPALAFFLFLPLAGLVGFVWWMLNWFLSLAGVFAVRSGEDAIGAISAAVATCRERAGAVFAVSAWTGLAHAVAFVAAMIALSMPLGFAAVAPWRLLVAGLALMTLAYFAVADWLYLARLAGYISILEMPRALAAPPPIPISVPPPGGRIVPQETAIDREESILSDLPNMAPEM